jgi:hypothetical protein
MRRAGRCTRGAQPVDIPSGDRLIATTVTRKDKEADRKRMHHERESCFRHNSPPRHRISALPTGFLNRLRRSHASWASTKYRFKGDDIRAPLSRPDGDRSGTLVGEVAVPPAMGPAERRHRSNPSLRLPLPVRGLARIAGCRRTPDAGSPARLPTRCGPDVTSGGVRHRGCGGPSTPSDAAPVPARRTRSTPYGTMQGGIPRASRADPAGFTVACV